MKGFNQNTSWQELKLTYLRLIEVTAKIVEKQPEHQHYLDDFYRDYNDLKVFYEKV